MSMFKDKKAGKILALMILGIFMFSFLAGVVSAVSLLNINIPGPLATPVDTTAWYGKVADFFGFGETWAQVLVSIFIFIIIIAGLYDILGLTLLRSPWVRVLIGIGIAGISSVVGFIRTITGIAFIAAGTISGIGLATVIGVAVVAFVLAHFGSSWLAVRMIRSRGDIEAEEAAAKAKKGAATFRGVGEGINE